MDAAVDVFNDEPRRPVLERLFDMRADARDGKRARAFKHESGNTCFDGDAVLTLVD
jgi:hypothetical protein